MRERYRRKPPVRIALIGVASFLVTLTSVWTSLLACPSCPVGRAAREQVCGEGFATNLMIAVVPFVTIALVSLWAERIGKAR